MALKNGLPMKVGLAGRSCGPGFTSPLPNDFDLGPALGDIAGERETIGRARHVHVGEQERDILAIVVDQRFRIVAARHFERAKSGIGAPKREHDTPISQGFGTRLEKASLATLRGTVEGIWTDDGLKIHLRFPTERVGH
ncbi:hypothetical protein [Sphingobium fuliginis]|uniref:hypothetical protein n=1 Tax=Sphingobium fuliginis (strain ATCC 27551) TaxID=336203 RepID=UPI001ABFC89B|nr:hypothetical protein [Sphingobium fuliginis]